MDGWYYKVFDSDFGPVAFEELVDLAKNLTLSSDDVVRFGENGPWRRAGSIGPLMAHFPFEAAEKVITRSTMSPVTESWDIAEADSEPSLDDFVISESSVATKPARSSARSAPANINKAPSDRRSHFDVAVSEPASSRGQAAPPADEPPVNDARWWCMIQGKEYGPVDLPKVIEWASTGRLHRDDFVRFGLQEYVRADELAELFPKLPSQQMQDTAPDIETKTEIRPKPAAPQASKPIEVSQPAVVSAAPKPIEVPTPAPIVSRPEPRPMPVTPSPSMSTGGFQGGSFAATRPAVPVRKPPAKSKSYDDGMGKLLASPAVLGGAGAVVFVVLMYFAIPYLPFFHSANYGRVKEISGALAEITKGRSGQEWKAPEAKAATERAKAIASRIIGELKDSKDKDAKKVVSLAKKLDELCKLDLTKPSDDDKKIGPLLNSVTSSLESAKRAVGM